MKKSASSKVTAVKAKSKSITKSTKSTPKTTSQPKRILTAEGWLRRKLSKLA